MAPSMALCFNNTISTPVSDIYGILFQYMYYNHMCIIYVRIHVYVTCGIYHDK